MFPSDPNSRQLPNFAPRFSFFGDLFDDSSLLSCIFWSSFSLLPWWFQSKAEFCFFLLPWYLFLLYTSTYIQFHFGLFLYLYYVYYVIKFTSQCEIFTYLSNEQELFGVMFTILAALLTKSPYNIKAQMASKRFCWTSSKTFLCVEILMI